MNKFFHVAKTISGKRASLFCQWWGVCVGRGGSLNSNGLAADVWCMTCWCMLCLWCKALQEFINKECYPYTSNNRAISSPLWLLVLDQGSLWDRSRFLFPRRGLPKPWGLSGHTFFPHSKCRGVQHAWGITKHAGTIEDQLMLATNWHSSSVCFSPH